jgi:uncharacterized protein YecT (DUF1311 family)
MFLPHGLVWLIKSSTSFLPWPWNAPFTVALATAVWVAILLAIRRTAGLVDFEFADRERLAYRSPSDSQRMAGEAIQFAIKWLIPLLWFGVAITALWTPMAAYVTSSASAPAWLGSSVRFWAEVATPYLYPGDSTQLPTPRPSIIPGFVTAANPSFNCAYANKWAEQQVCASSALAGYDVQMANLYATLITPLPKGAARMPLRLAQRAWLADRDRCQYAGTPMACLQDAYARRISELKTQVAQGQ